MKCQCEHVSHFPPGGLREDLAGTKHAYLAVPAGEARAAYVGPVCNECADTHMRDLLESNVGSR